ARAAAGAHRHPLARADADARAWLGAFWRGSDTDCDTDWDAVETAVARCARLRGLAAALAPDGSAAGALTAKVAGLAAAPAGPATAALAACARPCPDRAAALRAR